MVTLHSFPMQNIECSEVNVGEVNNDTRSPDIRRSSTRAAQAYAQPIRVDQISIAKSNSRTSIPQKVPGTSSLHTLTQHHNGLQTRSLGLPQHRACVALRHQTAAAPIPCLCRAPERFIERGMSSLRPPPPLATPLTTPRSTATRPKTTSTSPSSSTARMRSSSRKSWPATPASTRRPPSCRSSTSDRDSTASPASAS